MDDLKRDVLPVLKIRLVGSLRAEGSPHAIVLPRSKKARAILGVVGLSREHRCSRSYLASLLWDDAEEDAARASLRQALHDLAKSFEGGASGLLSIGRDTVSLNWRSCWMDIHAFGNGRCDPKLALAEIVTFNPQHLLEDLNGLSPSFDDWLLAERTALGAQISAEMERQLLAAHDPGISLHERQVILGQILKFDPTHEGASRALMRSYVQSGEKALALKEFDRCQNALRTALDVEPSSETCELYHVIRSGVSALPKLAHGCPALPDKPSIAVLPFQNSSNDPEQEYFADGMVEDIITALSRFKSILVIARSSSIAYKGNPTDLRQVGRELGVRYVLEGSVRKLGTQIRITGQLIETTTGSHLWADRFDGSLEHVFELQDRITEKVVASIAPKIEAAELARVRRTPIEDSTAYDYFLRGSARVSIRTLSAANEALQLFYRALEREPDFATAYGMATRCFTSIRTFRKLDPAEIQEARRLTSRAIELGPDDGLALTWSAQCLGLIFHDVRRADELIDHALEVNANSEAAWNIRATVSCWQGNFDLAIAQANRALRLSPIDPDQPQFAFAQAKFFMGEYGEAANAARRVLSRKNFIPAYRFLIASLTMDGKLDEARRVLLQVQGVSAHELIFDVYAPYLPRDRSTLAAALRRAGSLPENRTSSDVAGGA